MTACAVLLVTLALVLHVMTAAARGLPFVQTMAMDEVLRRKQQPGPPDCVNAPVQGASHQGVRLPDLHIELELRSERPRQTSEVTIITQCSFDRLPMLEAQCSSWDGMVSAAIYWPLLVGNATAFSADEVDEQRASLDAAKAQLAVFHARLESQGACRMDIVLLSEHIRPDLIWAYAYNSLRNHAVMRATTDAILLLDVDFVVTHGLHDRLSEGLAAEALAEDTTLHRHAVVLPAFETRQQMDLQEGHAAALTAVNGDKQQLQHMFQQRSVLQFAEFYPAGHKQTEYARWFNATEPYPIEYAFGYEPYLLVSRRLVPLFDERFRGYGFDKVMHIWQLHAQGFQLVAHPNAWVVHRPHLPSAGYQKAFTGPAYTQHHRMGNHMRQMEVIAKGMMAEIQGGAYPPNGVSALAACRGAPMQPDRIDKWWRRSR